MTFLTQCITRLADHWHNPVCRICLETPQTSPQQKSSNICSTCKQTFSIRHPSPIAVPEELTAPDFNLHAACIMTPELKQYLYPFKFYNRQEHLPVLSTLWTNYWHQWLKEQETNSIWHHNEHIALTHIPSRYNQYTHGHLNPLLKSLSQKTGLSPQSNLFQWSRETAPQHTITKRNHRLHNLKNSLTIHPEASLPSSIQGLVVFDDITTTGATFRAAYDALSNHPSPLSVVYIALAFVPLSHHDNPPYNQPSVT